MSEKVEKTIILFTRIPHAGTTKTRLMPFLKPEECVNLHFAFMADEIAKICEVADKLEVFYYEDESVTDDDRDEFRSFLIEEVSIPFLTSAQRGSTIFERMKNAFGDSFCQQPNSKKLLVGCDLPSLAAEDLKVAFESLEESDIVLCPSEDGGYCLVGMKQFCPTVFDVSGDGGETVLSDTLKKCRESGLRVSFGRVLLDVDLPKDLYRLYKVKNYMVSDSLARAFLDNFDESRFELFGCSGLKVSVIVPVFNEEKTIGSFLKNLEDITKKAEVIFVDGGSSDSTVSMLKSSLTRNSRLIESSKGRAHQMNEGAKVASGEALMFLHADCIPPKNVVQEVRRVLAYANWGCFGVKFDDSDPLMKICQIISNNRIRDRKVVFGDQGIFIKKDLFDEIGGFPEIPIMEDYQLSLTLKERGEKIGVAKGLITTSSRRYHEGGKLAVMWKMNRLRKAYRDGVPIEEISAAYADIR